jgi:hypothetical protein
MIRIGVFFVAIGFSCLLAFHLIGSSIDPNGFIQEPFGLLPIGYLLVFVGVLVALFGYIRLLISRRRVQSRGPADK